MPTFRLPLSELQTALYERLDGLLPVTVGDHIDENTQFPYATIGEFSVTPYPTKSDGNVYVAGTIDIWSKHEGMKECQQIADTICASLTCPDTYLALDSGYRVVHTTLDSFSTSTEYNGSELIRHGVLQIRWLIS